MRVKIITALAALLASAFCGALAQANRATAVAHSTEESRRQATVTFELSDGEQRAISFSRGEISVDGDPIGTYPQGSPLDRAWRRLIARAGELTTDQLVLAIRGLPVRELSPETAAAWSELTRALPPVPPGTIVPPPPAGLEAPAMADIEIPDANLNVDIGNIREEVRAAVAQARGAPGRDEPSLAARGVVTDVMGLCGMLVALASIGFGAVFFVPHRLEVVADTLARSPVRAFFAGLFTQPLLLPALLTMVVGLVLTIVGILVVPMAIIGFVLAVIAAVLGGYLAVARVMGEIYVRRTGRQNLYTTGWATYRYLVYGLIGLLAIWLPALALQWIPGAGVTLMLAAIVFTWMIATAGLGAVVLSRGGTRSTFGSKPVAQLSADFSWTTPRSTVSPGETRRTP
jgi:hypothetical protein